MLSFTTLHLSVLHIRRLNKVLLVLRRRLSNAFAPKLVRILSLLEIES